jgi:Serine hydrolase (FSH1)
MTMATTRHKVLALHGYTQVFTTISLLLTYQNGATFAKKAGALRKSLEKLGIELIFPTAPHKVLAANASSLSEREKLQEAESRNEEYLYWGWAFADEDKEEMRGLDKSIAFIAKILEEQVTLHLVKRKGRK